MLRSCSAETVWQAVEKSNDNIRADARPRGRESGATVASRTRLTTPARGTDKPGYFADSPAVSTVSLMVDELPRASTEVKTS